MKIKFYNNDDKIISGMTIRDEEEPEESNMALHVCYSKESVLQNRGKLASVLGCKIEDFVCPDQTHSANFYEAQDGDKGRGAVDLLSAIPDTDAVFTYEPNLLLCCFTADCVPLIFHNENEGLVGVVHSGWQGTIKEISLKVFRHLIDNKGCKPENFQIYIGKAIGQEKFEVGEDVYDEFRKLGYGSQYIYYNNKTAKYHVDNKQIVKNQCLLAGIPKEQISVDQDCTFLCPSCFSYRRDRMTGRHLSFIMRKSCNAT